MLNRPRLSGYRRGELSSVFGEGRLLGHGSLSKLGKNATLVDMDDTDRQWEMEFFMGMGKDKELSHANVDKSWEMEFLSLEMGRPAFRQSFLCIFMISLNCGRDEFFTMMLRDRE